MTDTFGRTITAVDNGDGSTTYSVTMYSATLPTSMSSAAVIAYFNRLPVRSAPATPPLNVTYDPPVFGQMLIDEFTQNNTINKSLTDAQDYSLAQELGPIYILLQTGALKAALTGLGNITVDGVMITSTDVTTFTDAIQAYLGGS